MRKIADIAKDVAAGKREEGVPARIRNSEDAQAFYGVLVTLTMHHLGETEAAKEHAAIFAEGVLSVIQEHRIVNIWQNVDVVKRLQNDIDDYFFDVVCPAMDITLELDELDTIEHALINIARARFPQ